MKTAETTPECSLAEHALCAGPAVIRRAGAPSWEAPLMTVTCDCLCHGGPAAARSKKRSGRR